MGMFAGTAPALIALVAARCAHPPVTTTVAQPHDPAPSPAVMKAAVAPAAFTIPIERDDTLPEKPACPLAAHPATVTVVEIPAGAVLLVTTPGRADLLRRQLHAIAATHNGILRLRRAETASDDGRSDGRSDGRTAAAPARVGWITSDSDARADDTPDAALLAFTTPGDPRPLQEELRERATALSEACAAP
jgi:hypothetical protein